MRHNTSEVEMLSMTNYPTPKFPTLATPEEVKAASEKVMNFWVGALSPMWVPFWAASGFGLSAWAMTQSLTKSEGVLKDMPQMADMAGKWPGFGAWSATKAEAAVTAGAEAVAEMTEPVIKAAKSAAIAAPKTAAATTGKVMDNASDLAETSVKAAEEAVEKSAGTVVAAVEATPEPKPSLDPVIKASVAPEPPVVSKATPKAPAKVEPKAIARSVSAVRKPKKS
jgi:hypothetical protein